MKSWMTLCSASVLVFSVSCTDEANDLTGLVEQSPVSGVAAGQSRPVDISFSRANLDEFAELGIADVSLFVYRKDSLIYGRNYSVDDEKIQIELPLGEELQTFAIANVDRIERTDSLSKTVIHLDESAQKEVYVSDIVSFTSDNSQPSLSLELKRVVGRAVLQPIEDVDALQSQTWFDRIGVTFTNVGTAYKVAEGKCVAQRDIVVSARKENGYSVSVYSFPTENAETEEEASLSPTAVSLEYYKNNALVNRTLGELKANVYFTASKSYNILLPVLEEGYLEKPLDADGVSRSDAGYPHVFSVVESEF